MQASVSNLRSLLGLDNSHCTLGGSCWSLTCTFPVVPGGLLPYALLIYLEGYSFFPKEHSMAQLTQTDRELYPVPVLVLKAALQQILLCIVSILQQGNADF